MTLKQAVKAVEEIKVSLNDPEMAHSLQDSLFSDFIESIATGKQRNITRVAKEIAKVNKIEFPRWTA